MVCPAKHVQSQRCLAFQGALHAREVDERSAKTLLSESKEANFGHRFAHVRFTDLSTIFRPCLTVRPISLPEWLGAVSLRARGRQLPTTFKVLQPRLLFFCAKVPQMHMAIVSAIFPLRFEVARHPTQYTERAFPAAGAACVR